MSKLKDESVLELLRHATADNGDNRGEELLRTHHPADVARALRRLEKSERKKLIGSMPLELRAWVIPFYREQRVEEMLQGCTDAQIAEVLEALPADDAVDLLQQFEARRRESVISEAAPALQSTMRTLLKCAPESAGALMTTEFLKFEGKRKVGEIIDQVREKASEVETPYVGYILTEEGQLRGVISLRDLLSADRDATVESLMNTEPVTVHVSDDQEEVARKIERYDVLALPVVDELGRVLGVVTHDDLLDVATEEATEDIFKSAGISFADIEASRSTAILDSSIPKILRLRLPWLLLALVGGMMAGGVIEAFEETLHAVVALAFFVPVIMDMGGNVGTQASTIFVRGLALGHIDDRNAMRHFRREGVIGLLIGLIVGSIGGTAAYLWQGTIRGEDFAFELGITVFVGLVTVCIVASVVGYVIPWVMNKLGFDPAAASDPLITTVKDVTALLIYFTLASVLLSSMIEGAAV